VTKHSNRCSSASAGQYSRLKGFSAIPRLSSQPGSRNSYSVVRVSDFTNQRPLTKTHKEYELRPKCSGIIASRRLKTVVDTRFKATICRAMAVGTGRFHLSKTFQTCSELEKSLSFPLRLQSLLTENSPGST